ncbi:hypothetical protein GCM10022419_065540 [Nonomuraea rosea]|uniref:NADH-quinone oxidoreductase subunit K n=1 Tax=Nonomuraea rosea TaxID=638574 RepID=A0ABP6Y1H6_9ACTN
MHIVYPAVVSALLFSVGVYGVLARRNTILVLMSVELMLNAVNLNLVAFDVWLGDRLHSGQVLTLFVIVIAAAEVGLGLAIVLALYRNRRTVDLDHLRDLAEPGEPGDEQAAEAAAEAPGDQDPGDLALIPAAPPRSQAAHTPADPADHPPNASQAGQPGEKGQAETEDGRAGEQPVKRGGPR